MNISEIFINESIRVQNSADTLIEQSKTDLNFTEFKPLGVSFKSKAIWGGVHSYSGVSNKTYGVYIIFKNKEPIYTGEGILWDRIGEQGFHYKVLQNNGITPDNSGKTSFMTNAYNKDPNFKDYEVVYLVIDTGDEYQNKTLGLSIESYIVEKFNLEEDGYNGPGQVKPFIIHTPNNQRISKTFKRNRNASKEDIIQSLKDYRESGMNKTQFAIQNNIGKSTFTKWTVDPRYKNVA